MGATTGRVEGTRQRPEGVAGRRGRRRTCACGGAVHSGGECEACRARGRGEAPAAWHRGAVVPASAAGVLGSAGRPLDPAVRSRMEAHFGHDFSRVRVHTGAGASVAARQLGARAFTVSDQVAFGSGEYRPGTPGGDRLLAHELAHVVQQGRGRGGAGGGRLAVGGGAAGGGARENLERGGRVAARALEAGHPAPPQPSSPPALLRDGPAAPPGAASEASRAELTCDLRTLCRLRFAAPDVVSPDRVRRAWGACRPGQRPAAVDPCLLPDPASLVPPAPAPASLPGGTGPNPTRSRGGLTLPSTNIRFNLGAARLSIDLPASLGVRLPVPFRGAEQVVFSLDASPERFSFSVAVNAVPHVRITARAGLTTGGMGSAGITVETSRTVCRAMDREAARTALQSAGERLRDAIRVVQDPPALAEDASDFERTTAPHRRMAEVVAAVANVNSAIERVRGRCRQVPVATFEFGVRGPVGFPGAEPPTGPSYVGGTATFRF